MLLTTMPICGKAAYSGPSEARRAINAIRMRQRRMMSANRGPIKPYFHERCGKWHVGHDLTKVS